MMPTMHADLYAAIFTSIVAVPWAAWLLHDLFKHERDRNHEWPASWYVLYRGRAIWLLFRSSERRGSPHIRLRP